MSTTDFPPQTTVIQKFLQLLKQGMAGPQKLSRAEWKSILPSACIAGLFITLYVNAPTLWIGITEQRWDTPLVVSTQNEDESRYLARIRATAEGYPLIGNPYIFEHREGIAPGGIVENVSGIPMRLFGWSLGFTLLLTDLLFPFINGMLAFFWLFAILKSKTGVWLVLLGTIVDQNVHGLLRDSSPKISLLFFNAYLCLLFCVDTQKIKWSTVRGIALGLLLWTYFYHWSIALVVEVLWQMLLTITSPREWKKIMSNAAACVATAALIILPLYILQQGVDPEFALQAWRRFGIVLTRMPTAPRLQLQVLAIFLGMIVSYVRFPAIRNKQFAFIFLIILGIICCLNSNQITGKTLEFQGHYYRVVSIFLYTAIILCARPWLPTKIYKGLMAILLVVGTISVLPTIPASIAAAQSAYTESEHYDNTQEYLASNIKTPSVIVAPRQLSMRIPVQTQHYVYMSHGAHFFFLSDKELAERYIVFTALYPEEIDPPDLRLLWIWGNYPGENYSRVRTYARLGLIDPAMEKPMTEFIPDQKLRAFVDQQVENPNPSFVRCLLHKYKADYLVADAKNEAHIKQFVDISRLMETEDGNTVYSITQNTAVAAQNCDDLLER